MNSRRTRTSKTRRWIELSLLLLGLIGAGIWGWSYLRLTVFQSWNNHELDRQIAKRPAIPVPQPHAVPPQNGALLGRLEIQRLNVRAVVREGADAGTLDVALGHIPGTALPGQAGNVGVAGHRDTLFRGLRKVEKDDLIDFQTPSANYRYKVVSTGIVKPKDVGVLAPGPNPEMTLVTCYPFNYVGSAPDRFIVKARLVQNPAPTPAPAPAVIAPTPVVYSKPKPVAKPVPARPTVRKIGFRLAEGNSREVAPGIRLGVSSADPARNRASVWVQVKTGGPPIRLKNQAAHQPVFFRAPAGGPQRELTITGVSRNSVTGVLSFIGRPPG